MSRLFGFYTGIIALLLAACGGLAGEPQVVATLPPPTSPPADVGFPETPPDLARGAQIFQQRCAECHGVGGRGDGELYARGEIGFPGDFTDPTSARAQTPEMWFSTITNGRLEKLMPPWRNALSEDERWAVALYTYTMSYTPEQLEAGALIWERECAECHGETGAGDGPRAAEVGRPGNLSDPVEMVFNSDSEYFEAISEGADDLMPAYSETLSEDERWAITAYTRALALLNTDVIGRQPDTPASTPEAEAVVSEGTISGRVTNGTAGGSIPEDLTVTLYLLEITAGGVRNETLETTTDADGNFRFENVTLDPERGYIVSAVYRERIFASDIIPGNEVITAPEMPLTVYDLTEDPTVIKVASIDIQVDALGEGLQILQEVVFRNNSDRLYTNTLGVGDNRFASVLINLPPGAAGVAFPDSPNRYIYVQEQATIVDTIPVVPGEDHTVLFSYFLPYEDGAVIEQQVFYGLDGTVNLRLYPDTIRVTSAQLTAGEPQVIQDRTYQVFSGNVALDPGGLLRYELSGAAQSVSTGIQVVQTSSSLTVVLIVVLIVLILLSGIMLFLFIRRSGQSALRVDRQLLMDGLVAQIAELDSQFEAGTIAEGDYRSQRDQLKTRLAQLMKETDTTS